MNRAKTVDPASRTIASCNCRDELDKDVVPVFETAKPLRLHEAEQLRVTHHADQLGGDVTLLFRLDGLLASDYADCLGAFDKLRHGRFCRASRSDVLDCADGHVTTSICESKSSLRPSQVSRSCEKLPGDRHRTSLANNNILAFANNQVYTCICK